MIFVLDTEKRPLAPCHPARARRLLSQGKAAIWRHYPFTIILKRTVPEAHPEPLRLKIDPGSRTTGLALLIVPNARGGSNRVSNLTIACAACNQAKGSRTAEEFGHPKVQARARRPLTDAAAVNASRWALYHRLQALGLPVEVGTGGRTKWNRTQRGLPKTHWIDAACVGATTPAEIRAIGMVPLLIVAMGRECRQMCRPDRFGFPRTSAKGTRSVAGLRTGDLVQAVVPSPSIKAGTYVGRLAVRASGYCNITTSGRVVQGIHSRYCRRLQCADGYTYQKGAALPLQPSGLWRKRHVSQ